MGKHTVKVLIVVACLGLFCGAAFAQLTPIARTDVVPYQRIEYGTTFKFGVVAFSKEGIDDVDFLISGQGYSSGTKTASSMTLNDRTNVWEYWVSIPTSEFTSNGTITVTPTVNGTDGGARTLDAVTLYVEGSSDESPLSAWVSTTGNDSTGEVDNSELPYATIAAAADDIQTEDGTDCDYAVIYLEEGTHSLASLDVTTTNEWLTITPASGAEKMSTIVAGGYPLTDKLHIQGVKIAMGASAYTIGRATYDTYPNKAWIDDCYILGDGYDESASNPIKVGGVPSLFVTSSSFYDIDYGVRDSKLVRNTDFDHFGNDALFNDLLVVNVDITDQDNSTTGWHSDGYQAAYETGQGLPVIDNRILFNVSMTDMHVDGLFLASSSGQASNFAMVNVLAELREPPMESDSGTYAFKPLGMEDDWEHLLIWNCSFPFGNAYVPKLEGDLTDSSVVGNLFWAFLTHSSAGDGPNIEWFANGNSYDNEFLHNHYVTVYDVTGSCASTPTQYSYYGYPCPHWYARMPDSNATTTATSGDPEIESNSSPIPTAGSPLTDRFTSVVPIDIDNTERGATSDVGAFELGSASVVSGTITADAMSEGELVSGGETVVFDIVNDTLVADISAYRQEFIDAYTSDTSEANGWNNEIIADEVVGAIVRTDSDTITWTLTANANYSITANDGPITGYIPHEMLTTATEDIVPTPSFTISNENPAVEAGAGTGAAFSSAASSAAYSSDGPAVAAP